MDAKQIQRIFANILKQYRQISKLAANYTKLRDHQSTSDCSDNTERISRGTSQRKFRTMLSEHISNNQK